MTRNILLALYEMIDGEPAPLEAGVSHQVSPQVLLEDIGNYNATLTVVFQVGPPIELFNFTLDVIDTNVAPVVISLTPR